MRRHTLRVLACLLASATSLPVWAQSFGEVMEVRITNLDVIVTDRNGKPVRGLTANDFELYEDGVRKEIKNFLEVSSNAPLSGDFKLPVATPESLAADNLVQDVRRRNIVVFIDNAAIDAGNRNSILKQLRQFLKTNARPGDEVSLITWSNTLKAELEPTSDLSGLDQVLERLARQGTFVDEQSFDRKTLEARVKTILVEASLRNGAKPQFSEVIGEARLYGQTVTHHARERMEALRTVTGSMRGAPGRKILVFVTRNFVTNPAEDAFLWLDSIHDQFSGPGLAINECRDLTLDDDVDDIVDAANSAGVTIYPIDGGGKSSGLRVIDATADSLIETSAIQLPETGQAALHTLADETGGVALTGTNNWQLAFDTISRDLTTYYSIGYSASGEKKDQLKKIEVRLRNATPKYAVRTRRSLMEQSNALEMNEAVAAFLFRESSGNDLGIQARAAMPSRREGEPTIIPLIVKIPMDKLTLIPDGNDLTGAFAVFTAFLNDTGVVSRVSRTPQIFRFPANTLSKRKALTFKVDIKTLDKLQGISVGVQDEASRATGFASIKLGSGS